MQISLIRNAFGVLVLTLLLAGGACGGPRKAEHAAARAPEATAPEASREPREESPAASVVEASNEPGIEASSGESTEPPLSSLCKTMCGAQSSECKPEKVKECTRNYCDRYGEASETCAPSVRAALECAKAEPDFLLCAHVVPDSCAKKFRATEDCLETGVAPVAEEAGPKIPDGWAKYQARDARFSVTMPKNVEVTNDGGVRVWSSEEGGAKYEIRREPLPDEKKFDQRAFLRIATKLLGKCAPKMKLFSLVETEERSIIQFQTKCPDGSQQRGVLYVHGKDYFVARASWGPEANPDAETFAYSFEHR